MAVPFVPLILKPLQFVDVVSHVADAGHAACDIQDPVESLRVRMHVEHARQECFAASVDSLCIRRHLHGTRWTDR